MRLRLHAPQRIFAFMHSLSSMCCICDSTCAVQYAGWGGVLLLALCSRGRQTALVVVVVHRRAPMHRHPHCWLAAYAIINGAPWIHAQVMVHVAPLYHLLVLLLLVVYVVLYTCTSCTPRPFYHLPDRASGHTPSMYPCTLAARLLPLLLQQPAFATFYPPSVLYYALVVCHIVLMCCAA